MRTISILAFGLLVCACASSEVAQLPGPQPIICTVGADCDAKWSRAVAWIARNSSLKVLTQTETMVQTTAAARSEPTPAFTVTKVARGSGRYEIAFNGGCGDVLRCVPSVSESRAQFTDFVLGEDPAARLSQ